MARTATGKPQKIRESKGGAYESRGSFFVRITVAPQDRQHELAPWATSLEDAQARAHVIQALVNRLRASGQTDFIEKLVETSAAADEAKMGALASAVDRIIGESMVAIKEPGGPTVATLASLSKRWTSGELAREFPDYIERKRSWRDDEYRAKHVPEKFRDLPLTAWRIDTFEEVMRGLSKKLGSGSRRQVAQFMHRIFELAVYPLRLVASNPIPRMPKVRQEKLLATLYPGDAGAVAKCEDIDIGYRVLWTFLAESGWRISEAVGRQEPKSDDGEDESIPPLTWKDIDFTHERAFLSRTKTTGAVEVPLDEPTLEGLKIWRAMSPRSKADDCVFVLKNGEPLTVVLAAETFRAHLTIAGVSRETRPDLFPEGAELKSRLPVRVHDLRGLFVTASLAQGRSDTWVRERTRHKTTSMLDVYRRNVAHFKKHGPIAPMVECIPEFAAAFAAAGHGGKPEIEEEPEAVTVENPEQFQRVDSNHDKRNQKRQRADRRSAKAGKSRENVTSDDGGGPPPRGVPPRFAAASLDASLARALDLATLQGDLGMVRRLLDQIEQRQRAAAGNVVAIGSNKVRK